MTRSYYVYILANTRGRRPVLYIGVTNDLESRLREHERARVGFVAKYNARTLVHAEPVDTAEGAIAREKQLKGYSRGKKLARIVQTNPGLRDLRSRVSSE